MPIRTQMCVLLGINLFFATRSGYAELVYVTDSLQQNKPILVEPGEIASALVLLGENVTPVIGYSLEIDLTPVGTSFGTLTADASLSNFFDSQNLISAGGAAIDPQFSTILDQGGGGIFVTAITEDLSAVLATKGVNDVLVQILFRASDDAAIGDEFLIEFGINTALSDSNAFPVPFEISSGLVRVVPEPMTACLILTAIGILTRKVRKGYVTSD